MTGMTTLAGQFKEAADDLYQHLQADLDRLIGKPGKSRRVRSDCWLLSQGSETFTVEVTSAEIPGWGFRRDLLAQTLTSRDDKWENFKRDCSESMAQWFRSLEAIRRPSYLRDFHA